MPAPLLALLVAVSLSLPAVANSAPDPSNPETAGTRRFAVTLLSSFDPIPENLLPTDMPKKVYRTRATVFGRAIHFARVGFYATAGEAELAKTKLLARYPAAFVTEITVEEYHEATGGSPPAATLLRAPATAPVIVAPKPAARDEIFVVTLNTDPTRVPTPRAPLPDALSGRRLYARDLEQDGQHVHALHLGFFFTPTEAERARRQLLADYPEARVRLVTAEERDASSRTALRPPNAPLAPVMPVAPIPAPSLAAAGPATIESEAITLIDRARDALTRGDNIAAIQTLSKLLQLPPNRQSQEAQELIGVAEERSGNSGRARQEYELYLKLHPEGSGADRVRQRLASLSTPTEKPALKAAKRRDADITTMYGGFSQYYYHGNSRIDSTLQTATTLAPQETLTLTDQSALISNIDLNGRIRRGDWDNRFVVRNTHTWNFLEGTENQNRLYSAYAESRYKAYDIGGRIGRQPGNSGGILGRFDGALLNYGVLPKWRLSLVAGEPVEFNPINSDKSFWGVSVDFGPFAENWSGNLYYVHQTVDGFVDREAAGTELRYFDPQLSAFSLIDYDLGFGALNIGMLQMTKLFGTRTSVNLLIDHRKAPILTLSNALIGEIDTSIKSQLQTQTEEQLRAQANARTAESNLYLIGANHNFNTKWQIGGDIKLFNTTGTPASGPLPATEDSGNTLAYTVQGIATSMFSKRDISVLALSYIDSPTFSGRSASLSNRTLLRDRWTFDIALRYYGQENDAGDTLTRWSPNLRLGYRWHERFTLEAEYGLEKSETESATSIDESTRNYFSLGYRWDF